MKTYVITLSTVFPKGNSQEGQPTHFNALLLQYSENWFTPAYIFAYAHFAKRLNDGGYPKSPVIIRKETPRKEPQKITLPTSKIDKTGQYLLF